MIHLSIVTVVYNEADGIKHTLECIKKLKKSIDFEYIIIDGNSDDGTVDVIKKYSEIVDKFISEKDNGIYDAMNKGIRLANGAYVGLLNAGDTYVIDSIERVYEIIKKGKYDLIYGSLNILDEDRNLNTISKALPPAKMFFCGPKSLNHPTFFIKKSVYKDLGYYNLNYDTAGDFEFLYNVYLEKYSFYKTNLIHSNFVKGGASYRKSPLQKILIYKKYFLHNPFISSLSILQKIIIKYPLFQIIKFIPKPLHLKYKKMKFKI